MFTGQNARRVSPTDPWRSNPKWANVYKYRAAILGAGLRSLSEFQPPTHALADERWKDTTICGSKPRFRDSADYIEKGLGSAPFRESGFPVQDIRRISIVTPCYNEEDNVEELYARISGAVAPFTQYNFVFLFIDNHSTDRTVEKIKALAARDRRIRLIVNTRNFGHNRSPYYGILQGGGAATIYLASDLQDPPELIPEFIRGWEEGYKIVLATKPKTEGAPLFAALRKLYYRLLNLVSEVPLVNDVTGFGLYDRVVLDHVRKIGDPYPYFRGLICELGYEIRLVPFIQPRRLRGVTKNNLYTLFDFAMLGIVRHSKLPLRIATFAGFVIALLSLATGSVYLVLKLLYWETFPLGIAPLIVGLFFLFGMLFLFIGVLGEYIASIHTYVQKRPVVVEQERFNFDADDE